MKNRAIKKFMLRQHRPTKPRYLVSRANPKHDSVQVVGEMVAITNACTEWIVFGQVELDKDNAATIDVMRRALLPSNACVPALPVRGCWHPDSDS